MTRNSFSVFFFFFETRGVYSNVNYTATNNPEPSKQEPVGDSKPIDQKQNTP
jgi:hypothetical protein